MTRFPDNFLWGAATAAYQIEGSPLADGAGASIWQRFSHDPRLMATKGDTGDVACDHYNRMESDVALMKSLGLAGLSLLDRLGARASRGHRARERGRAGVLRAAGRHADRQWHRAVVHLVPLGHARRARRPRRLAQPRQRDMVRRLCADRVRAARRAGQEVGHAQRAVGRDRRRLSPRRARPGAQEHVRSPDRQPQSHARARRRGEGLSRGRRARDRARRQHRAQISRQRQPRGYCRDGARRRLHEPPVSRPRAQGRISRRD